MAIEDTANNPLGLTTAGPGYSTNATYPGQNGTVTSGAGFTFATFPDQATGIAAGVQYITNKITSGAATTVQQLVNLFSPNDLTAFEQTTGLSANSPLDPAYAQLYAAGIAAGEGTLNNFPGLQDLGPELGKATPSGNTSITPTANAASTSTLLSWFQNLFTVNNGERVLAIIAGVLLVIIALVALLSKSSAGQTIITQGKSALKNATTVVAS